MARRHLLGWGAASDGQLGETMSDVFIPRPISGLPSTTTVVDFAPGLWSSLIITPNTVLTTRAPDFKPLAPTSLPSDPDSFPVITAAAKGRDFSLLLANCGSLFSIGTGAYGELGLGDRTSVSVPTKIESLLHSRMIAVAASEFHWLALDTLGSVFSCGNNASGQLGLAHSNPVSVPTRVTALWPHPIVSISTGDGHSAALSADGTLFCFGSNKHGQLGNSSFRVRVASLSPALVPMPRPQYIKKSTANIDGGDPMDVDSLSPADSFSDDAVHEESTLYFVDISCGSAHTIALRNDGALLCWGKGENGQLGTRATRTMYEPTEIHTRESFVAVSAGERHSAAVTADGRAFMWGDGSAGQLGDGEGSDKYVPIELAAPRVPGDVGQLRFLKIRCGGFHTLALAGDESLSVYNAVQSHEMRIPRCVVDNMLQAKAGLSRFGSASVLLRTFLRRDRRDTVGQRVDYVGAETAHAKFLRMFGDDGRRVLRLAASRIRHQAQVAFGLVRGGERTAFGDGESLDVVLVTSKLMFGKGEDSFRSSVANATECGYLFFIALMNPIYGQAECVAELAELAAVLLRCEEKGRKAFIESIANCELDVLVNRVIRPLQDVLTSELKGYRRITRNAIFATKMLALCYHGMWRRLRSGNLRDFRNWRKLFYNEAVSEMVDFGEDYERWRQYKERRRLANEAKEASRDGGETSSGASALDVVDLPPLPIAGQDDGPFAFCTYSFLLTEEAKFKILQHESHITMEKEAIRSLLSFGAAQTPIGAFTEVHVPAEQVAQIQSLVLSVYRSRIVSDTYVQIAHYAYLQPRELRKPLKVVFVGEEGVDEGGVSKEFFQVLMERILSPDYGMFEYDDETNFHWFRKDFLEPEDSWQLIGIIFGLAAFNSILLDVQFPPVVYRKLSLAVRNAHLVKRGNVARFSLSDGLRYKADLNDVKETFPSIGNSLQHLRDYEGDDVEDVFNLTFEISYLGLFDKLEVVELIANGGNIAVTNSNREEFITLYTEYLINNSIERAFSQFAAGFVFMLDGPFVNELMADDLETLVIGEKELDFSGLRRGARYEGYDENSPVILHLWQILDEYDEEMKRLFLAFVTGTDRAPIGGLGKLKLIIQREGPDNNRLPTSRTCFNVLLLPEYTSRAKLRDRLSTAIRNSKGFGLE